MRMAARSSAAILLGVLSLLAVVWFAPAMPSAGFDEAWPFALNVATARRLVFGRDVLYNFGPWSSVYTGQYSPATDGLMVSGGLLVAVAVACGLIAIAGGARICLAMLLPLLVASVGLHDPVFMVLPMLLLTVSVALSQPAGREAGIATSPFGVGALLLLAAADALLSLVKLTFGTEALVLAGLSIAALAAGRKVRLAISVLASYAISVVALWLLSGQRLPDIAAYVASVPLVVGGYAEGAAWDGPATDIVAYLLGAAFLLGASWRDRSRLDRRGQLFIGTGLLATLFLAFKSGFVRHDEHALIALGTLAMLPLVVSPVLRVSSTAAVVAATAAVLAFVASHHAGQNWPSPTRTAQRLGGAARGIGLRIAEPERLPRRFAADLASIAARFPLRPVTGPTDIYSSGQTILIANGLDYAPRPALQSFTAFGRDVLTADLWHLEGMDGREPVRNVFFRIEHTDFRAPTTEDGPSWPALLGEFRATGFDPGLDLALFQRRRPPGPVDYGAPLASEAHPSIGEVVPIPVSPTGLIWATIEIRPTRLGRLVSFLFRPPVLRITIDYASGPPQRSRLLSGLGAAGFLLGPRVSDTADMLRLLLPESRAPAFRPVSIRLTGGGGTSWLWRRRFAMALRSIALPVQPGIGSLLAAEPPAGSGGR